MANFFLKTANQLRQPLACLSAFAAGCLIAGVTSADENDNQSSRQNTRLERLFSEDAVEYSAPPVKVKEDGLSKITDSLGQRSVEPLRNSTPMPKIEAGPSANEILGGIKQVGNWTNQAPKARMVIPKPVWTPPPTQASQIPVTPAPVASAPVATQASVAPQQEKRTLSQYAASLASWQEPTQSSSRQNRATQITQQRPVQRTAAFQQPSVQPDVTQPAYTATQTAYGAYKQQTQMAQAQPMTGMQKTPRTQPVARPATSSTMPVNYGGTGGMSGVHKLENLTVSSFESMVLSTWGARLKTASSPDGRFVRVQIPTRVNERMAMLIDRQTKTVSYEGDEQLRDNWHRLMSHMDTLPQRRVDGSVVETVVIDTGNVAMSTIRQATFLMGLNQDQESTTLPADTFIPGTVAQGDQIPAGTQGIKNTVKIYEDPETGAITLIGDPADLVIVRGIINKINKEDKQPIVDRIPLTNLQSEAIAEQVQTIYDSNFASSGSATIQAIQSPNMLMVVGQPKSIEAVRNIVSRMDVTADSSTAEGFKTIRLKYISAADAKVRLDTYFGQANLGQGTNTLPSAPTTVIADFRTNSVTIKGSGQFIAQAEALLEKIDVVGSEHANKVKVVKLRNTVASELAQVIQDAINGQQTNAGLTGVVNPNGGAQPQPFQLQSGNDPNQSTIGAQALSITRIDEDGRATNIESGVLFEVRVIPDTNSNSLIVSGPEQSLDLVLELIKQLDRIPDAETQLKVFEIVNGDAAQLLNMLQALFGADTQTGGQQQQGGLAQLPLQSASSGESQALVNLRFTLDARTNTIIASGPAGDLIVVEDLLNRLDGQLSNRREVMVYRLSNAPALDVAEAVNAYLVPRNQRVNDDPREQGSINQVNQNVIVVAEINSNSLIVDALPEYRAEIEEVIRALDRRPPMVKVKVLIAEIDLNTLEEFGVEIGVQDSLLFDRGTSIAGDGGALTGIGFPFNNPSLIPNANGVFPGTVAGQALSSLGTGRVNSELGYGGLVLSAGNESINVLMRALQDRSCVRVLSKPHIMTMENLQGSVSIGSIVPRVVGTTSTNFGITQTVTDVPVGVLLEVTPRVSPDGMIVMAVNAKKSAVGPNETAIPIGFGDDGTPILSPQILETEANTTLMARSGQTVVFSGLIQEEKTHTERGAPILSDLPFIGPLFKFESDAARRTELLIVLTPYLVNDESDVNLQNQDEMDRMHWCRCDVAEVYGNTDYDGFQGNGSAIETIYPDADPIGANPQIINGQIEAPQPGFEGAQRSQGQHSNQVQQANYDSDQRRR